MRSARATQPQSPRLAPESTKKKKKNKTRARKTKATSAELEDFVDWTATRFSVRMRERAADSKGETTPKFGGKRLRRSSLDEEAKKDWAIISVDSPYRAPNDHPALEGAPNEVSASLEEAIPAGGLQMSTKLERRPHQG